MRIEKAIENAKATVESLRNSTNPELPVGTIYQAESLVEALEKAATMTADEIARIKAIPSYISDMRDVKDIKEKYGISWNDIKYIRTIQF